MVHFIARKGLIHLVFIQDLSHIHIFSERGAARAEDAQGTPTQIHISASLLVYEDTHWWILTFPAHICQAPPVASLSVPARRADNFSSAQKINTRQMSIVPVHYLSVYCRIVSPGYLSAMAPRGEGGQAKIVQQR